MNALALPLEPSLNLTPSPDLHCSVCFRLLVEPISLPCAHVFCAVCVEELLKSQPKCPLCRLPLGPHFTPQIDPATRLKVQEACQSEFEREVCAQEQDKVALRDSMEFQFEVGNSFEKVSKLNFSQGRRVGRRPIWQFFVRQAGRQDIRHFIDKVVIRLAGRSEERAYVLRYPFEFSATADLAEIPYEVVWRDWVKLKSSEGAHTLMFAHGGSTQAFTVRYSDRAFNEYLKSFTKESMR